MRSSVPPPFVLICRIGPTNGSDRHCLAADRYARLRPEWDSRSNASAWDWVEDLRQAVSFLQTLPTIAPDRIGVVGMSMGGGVACIAAGIDERLRVIVALAPVVDGQDWFRHLWITKSW